MTRPWALFLLLGCAPLPERPTAPPPPPQGLEENGGDVLLAAQLRCGPRSAPEALGEDHRRIIVLGLHRQDAGVLAAQLEAPGVRVRADAPTNSLVVLGESEALDAFEGIVAALDPRCTRR